MFTFGNYGGGSSGGVIVLSASTSTPAYGASVTITATPSAFTPTSYTFYYKNNYTAGTYTSTTQAGNSLAITAIGYGATKVYVSATDGSNTALSEITLTIAQMSPVTSFFSTTGISDATIQSAIRTFALSAKDSGFWDASTGAIWPLVGGSLNTHKYDLKSLLVATLSGGYTHNANGITGNGVDTHFNTTLNNNAFGQNSLHISLWNRTTSTNNYDASGGTTPRTQLAINTSTNTVFDCNNTSGAGSVVSPSDVRGWWILQRDEAGTMEVWHNAKCLRKLAATSSAPANAKIYFGCFGNSGSPVLISSRNYSFLSVGTHLTPLQIAQTYIDLQTMNTTLGR